MTNLSTLSSIELWHLGKKQYRDGSYKPALETFTVLTKKDEASIELLEYIASIHAKLETWNEALKCGRHIISLDPQDARGYLCTGKILTKMNQKRRAIAIYDIGFSKVLPTDRNFPKLLKIRDAATGTVISPNHKDPLSVLPPELLLQIFQLVGFRELVKCFRVSKLWKSFLTGWPELWTTMDFSETRAYIRPTFVKSCIRFSNYRLKHFKSGRFTDYKTYWAMAKCCRQLQTIELSTFCTFPYENFCSLMAEFKSLESVTLCMQTSLNKIPHIISRIPKLVEIRFLNVTWTPSSPYIQPGDFNNKILRTFECRFNPDTPFHSNDRAPFQEFLQMYQSLETLILDSLRFESANLIDFSELKSLRFLQLSNSDYWEDVRFPSTLSTLLISGLDGKRLTSQRLPFLERLEIGDCKKPQLVVEKLLNEFSKPIDSEVADADAMQNIWGNANINGHIGPLDESENLSFSNLRTFKIECRQYLADVYHGIMRMENNLEETLTHPRLAEVENLVLKGGGIDDSLLEHVIQDRQTFTTKLVQIAFDSARVTGVSIKMLVERQSSLKVIWLLNCGNVGSDAVEWARSKGVNVQVRRGC